MRLARTQASSIHSHFITAAELLRKAQQDQPVDWTAARGQAAAQAAWCALSLAAVDKLLDPLTKITDAFFEQMAAAQQPTGAWLATSSADNIETRRVRRTGAAACDRQLPGNVGPTRFGFGHRG